MLCLLLLTVTAKCWSSFEIVIGRRPIIQCLIKSPYSGIIASSLEMTLWAIEISSDILICAHNQFKWSIVLLHKKNIQMPPLCYNYSIGAFSYLQIACEQFYFFVTISYIPLSYSFVIVMYYQCHLVNCWNFHIILCDIYDNSIGKILIYYSVYVKF